MVLKIDDEGPDKTPHFAVSDLGLQCLLRPVRLTTNAKYGN